MNSEFKVDLHTHSIISYDGGISADEYVEFLRDKNHIVSVTDHNEISFAQELHHKFPEQVIVGEEIMTSEGEIIGLFLQSKIEPGLSVEETCKQIRNQQGLVYIPHPLETARKGLQLGTLQRIVGSIDIIEVYNARLRQPWLQKQVLDFANQNNLVQAASSDAHGKRGLGSSYTLVNNLINRESLIMELKQGRLVKQRASWLAYLDPMRNKLRKKLL